MRRTTLRFALVLLTFRALWPREWKVLVAGFDCLHRHAADASAACKYMLQDGVMETGYRHSMN